MAGTFYDTLAAFQAANAEALARVEASLPPERREMLRHHLEEQAIQDYRLELAALAIDLARAMGVGKRAQPQA